MCTGPEIRLVRLLTVITVVAVIGASAGPLQDSDGDTPVAAAPPRIPRDAIRVQIGAAPQSRPVPPGFVGLSIEYRSAPGYFGTPADPDRVFQQLVRNLAPGRSPVLRFGGDPTDWTWAPTPGVAKPAGIRYTLGPEWMRSTRAAALVGPASGASQWLSGLGQYLTADPRVRLVTFHRYPLHHCFTPRDSLEFPTISNCWRRRLPPARPPASPRRSRWPMPAASRFAPTSSTASPAVARAGSVTPSPRRYGCSTPCSTWPGWAPTA
jgi:hypothetical protein